MNTVLRERLIAFLTDDGRRLTGVETACGRDIYVGQGHMSPAAGQRREYEAARRDRWGY